jgi:hypothetical protein
VSERVGGPGVGYISRRSNGVSPGPRRLQRPGGFFELLLRISTKFASRSSAVSGFSAADAHLALVSRMSASSLFVSLRSRSRKAPYSRSRMVLSFVVRTRCRGSTSNGSSCSATRGRSAFFFECRKNRPRSLHARAFFLAASATSAKGGDRSSMNRAALAADRASMSCARAVTSRSVSANRAAPKMSAPCVCATHLWSLPQLRLLLADVNPPRFDRAIARWHARFVLDADGITPTRPRSRFLRLRRCVTTRHAMSVPKPCAVSPRRMA